MKPNQIPTNLLDYEQEITALYDEAEETDRHKLLFFGSISKPSFSENYIIVQSDREAMMSGKNNILGYFLSDSEEFPVIITFNNGLVKMVSNGKIDDNLELLTLTDKDDKLNPELTDEEFKLLTNLGYSSLGDILRKRFIGIPVKTDDMAYVGSWSSGLPNNQKAMLSPERKILVSDLVGGEFVLYK